MLVKVTEIDIKNGRKSDPCRCPVALAIKKELKNTSVKGQAVYVGPKHAFLRESPSWQLPIEATQFINRFDRGQKVEPFEFQLDVGRYLDEN